LSGATLSGLALDRGKAYSTRDVPESSDLRHRGELLSVSLSTGATTTLATLGETADQIVSSGGWIVWRKRREPALPGVPFVVAAAPVTVIRAVRKEGGVPHVTAALNGDQNVRGGEMELLGVARDCVYWYERNTTPEGERTAIRRAPCSGGPVETLVEEAGSRRAVLEGDVLVWTAPSLEAGSPAAFSSVKRMELGVPGVSVIGDWLDSGTVPLLSNGQVYSQDRADLWRLGAQREEQVRLYRGPSRETFPRAIGDEEFMFLPRDSGLVLARRPLTPWARVRSAVWR
jgi:hypothetical protein